MIKHITGGQGVTVNQSYSSWPSFYNTGNSLAGQMRYNGTSQNMEVYDGCNWITIASVYPTIELAPQVQAVVHWAQIKMAEEARLAELAKINPAVAAALEAVSKAQEQARIVAALVDTE